MPAGFELSVPLVRVSLDSCGGEGAGGPIREYRTPPSVFTQDTHRLRAGGRRNSSVGAETAPHAETPNRGLKALSEEPRLHLRARVGAQYPRASFALSVWPSFWPRAMGPVRDQRRRLARDGEVVSRRAAGPSVAERRHHH